MIALSEPIVLTVAILTASCALTMLICMIQIPRQTRAKRRFDPVPMLLVDGKQSAAFARRLRQPQAPAFSLPTVSPNLLDWGQCQTLQIQTENDITDLSRRIDDTFIRLKKSLEDRHEKPLRPHAK